MRSLALTLIMTAGLAATGAAMAEAVVGQPAPAFAGADLAGKPLSLGDFKGKYVVLEWTNPQCPFVEKHYGSGNMPSTQKQLTDKGVTWISIQTVGKEDADRTRTELQAWQKTKGASPTKTLVDADGTIARAYQARTTPHMYVVDPQGKLIYAGAIDSKPTANAADVKTATNYVAQALGEAMSGKAVSQATTRAYGCSVKYPS
ncbi:MAG TPA: redoxin domain-containing protein [Ideonella sp.]|uniref:redoxin domain-containing protein n=1 Tax=Ideonella sp. TaxID=1929293 RepID=UPI002E324095|nr:redoxin domain-containing protein [Ideonella sp.]HEX5683954.1 redoxin domain-containing protein [Ideonella sp.]